MRRYTFRRSTGRRLVYEIRYTGWDYEIRQAGLLKKTGHVPTLAGQVMSTYIREQQALALAVADIEGLNGMTE